MVLSSAALKAVIVNAQMAFVASEADQTGKGAHIAEKDRKLGVQIAAHQGQGANTDGDSTIRVHKGEPLSSSPTGKQLFSHTHCQVGTGDFARQVDCSAG